MRKHVSFVLRDRRNESLLQPYVHEKKTNQGFYYAESELPSISEEFSPKNNLHFNYRPICFTLGKAAFIKRLVLRCMYECTFFAT